MFGTESSSVSHPGLQFLCESEALQWGVLETSVEIRTLRQKLEKDGQLLLTQDEAGGPPHKVPGKEQLSEAPSPTPSLSAGLVLSQM